MTETRVIVYSQEGVEQLCPQGNWPPPQEGSELLGPGTAEEPAGAAPMAASIQSHFAYLLSLSYLFPNPSQQAASLALPLKLAPVNSFTSRFRLRAIAVRNA